MLKVNTCFAFKGNLTESTLNFLAKQNDAKLKSSEAEIRKKSGL